MPNTIVHYMLSLVLLGLSVGTIAISLRRRRSPGAISFYLFMLTSLMWSIGHLIGSYNLSYAWNIIALKVKASSELLAPALWLFYSSSYLIWSMPVKSIVLLGLMLLPLSFSVVIWDRSMQTIIATGINQTHYLPGQIPGLLQGPALDIAIIISIVYMTLSTIIGVYTAANYGGVHRRQAVLHLVATFILIAGSIGRSASSQLPFIPFSMPLALIASTAILLWSLMREGLLRSAPIAKSSIVARLTDGVLVLDSEQRVVDMNLAAETMLGPTMVRQIMGHRVTKAIPFMAGETLALEGPGGKRYLEIRVCQLGEESSELQGYLLELHDVTETRKAQDAMTDANARLQLVLEATNDSIWDWDVESDSFYISPHLYALMGYESTKLPDSFQEWRDLIHPGDRTDIDLIFHGLRFKTISSIDKDIRIRTRSGSYQWINIKGRVMKPVQEETSVRVVGLHSDSTIRRSSEALVSYRAFYDELTGLPNRFLLLDRLQLEFARATRLGCSFALAFCDLNEFKYVNDTMGHLTGDELLRQVAKRIMGSVRESDTVSRLGGDEFVLILPGMENGKQEAAIVAERIMESMSQPFLLDDRQITITCSLGIAFGPIDGDTSETLMKAADTAMYAAKARGKNYYMLYSPGLSPHDGVSNAPAINS